MENNPLNVMYAEHDIIMKAENIIKNLDKVWENDEEKYKEVVTTLITFFREYADGYHHRKEEEVLFPAIHGHPDFVLQEILEEFETHHEDFREYTTEIEDAIAEGDYEKSYKELNSYVQDLLDHIGAENDELFSLAESLIDEDDLETIFFKFKDIDMELGEERKVELEKSIDNILV
ncbi:MAG: hemerythrin domain-containing protein [Flavobacteriales bacterium]|nr:hemerythrin domain-containing protein [Flavobacteriales bacterium]